MYIYSNVNVSSSLLNRPSKTVKECVTTQFSIFYYHRTVKGLVMCWNLPSYAAQIYSDYMMQYTQYRKCIHSVTIVAHSLLLWLLRFLKYPLCNYNKAVKIMDKISCTWNVYLLYPSQILLETLSTLHKHLVSYAAKKCMQFSDFNCTCQNILVQLTSIKVQGHQLGNTWLHTDVVKLIDVCLLLVARNKCGGMRNTSKGIPMATHEHVARYEVKLHKINMKVINKSVILVTWSITFLSTYLSVST